MVFADCKNMLSDKKELDLPEDPRDKPKPFLQHLEELRWTIIWSLGVFGAALLVCIPLTRFTFRLLCAPLARITVHPEYVFPAYYGNSDDTPL